MSEPATVQVEGVRPEPETDAPADRRRTSGGLIGPFTARQLLAVLASVLGAALVLVVLTAPISTPRATPIPRPGATVFDIAPPVEGLQVGQRAPELEGSVDGRTVGLVDLEGRPIRLADLRGRPVWIIFWAPWCPPCQAETPVLRDVYERYRDKGLALVAVSVQETSPEDVREYARTYGLGYTIGFDATSAVFKAYRAYGLPTQFFVDGDGVIRHVVRGPLTAAEAEAILAPLVAAGR